MSLKKRVALFQAKMPLHSQTANAATQFAEAGYHVDVFLYQSSMRFCNLGDSDRIHVFNLSTSVEGDSGNDGAYLFQNTNTSNKKVIVFGTGNMSRSISENVRDSVHYYVDNDYTKWGSSFLDVEIRDPKVLLEENVNEIVIFIASTYYSEISVQLVEMGFIENIHFFHGSVLDTYSFYEAFEKAKSILNKNKYTCFVGVEKTGMIWAGNMAEIYSVPTIYFSLELYTSDHPIYSRQEYSGLLQEEKKYHQQSIATIIQDDDRADILYKHNTIPDTNHRLLVPVSVLGDSSPSKSGYLREKFGIPSDANIILYFGQISPGRYSEELIRISNEFADNCVFVLHGGLVGGPREYLDSLLRDQSDKTVLSLECIDSSEAADLISSADIGLVFYPNDHVNNYLTGSSSEKVALYLQSGLPIITFNYPSFEYIIQKYNCGICIEDFSQLNEAINVILRSYNLFSENALVAYKEHYEFSGQFNKVLKYIESL